MNRINFQKQPSNRAVGYVRRSTDRQEQSISDQKGAIEEYALKHSLRLTKFYVDDAISGTNTLGRKAFLQMINDAQRFDHRFDIVVVYDVKRFGRIDNDEAGYYRHILRINGVEVRYVSENFSGDTTDDLLRPVKQWQARQESKDLSKVSIRGLLRKVEGGWWMGGVPPYGYDLRYENADGKFLFIVRFMQNGSKQILNEKGGLIRALARGESINISKRDKAKLTLSDPHRVEVIKKIFQMYASQGKGYNSVADTLNRQGVPTPRGPQWSHIYSGKWKGTTIRCILTNPIYSGDMVWNRRSDGRFHRISQGQAVDREDLNWTRLVPNNKEDWIIVRDAHPPLIKQRLFEQARHRLEINPKSIEQKRKYNGKTWSGLRCRFILSGLMRCSLCGNRYQGVTRTKGKERQDGTRLKISYYDCGGYLSRGRKICETNPIEQKVLEEIVIKTLLNFYKPFLDKEGRKKMAEYVKAQLDSEAEEFVATYMRIRRQLNKINKTIDNLLENITPTNREYVDLRLIEFKQKKLRLRTRLDELDRLSLSLSEINSIVSDSMKFLTSLEFVLYNGAPQEKLVALRQCIEKIDINKPAGWIKLTVYLIPTGNPQTTRVFSVLI